MMGGPAITPPPCRDADLRQMVLRTSMATGLPPAQAARIVCDGNGDYIFPQGLPGLSRFYEPLDGRPPLPSEQEQG